MRSSLNVAFTIVAVAYAPDMFASSAFGPATNLQMKRAPAPYGLRIQEDDQVRLAQDVRRAVSARTRLPASKLKIATSDQSSRWSGFK